MMSRSRVVEPLAQNYIVKYFEGFPIRYLSILPLMMHRKLLWQLSIADTCLWLENTDLSKGLDMAALPVGCFRVRTLIRGVAFLKDSDIELSKSAEAEYVCQRQALQVSSQWEVCLAVIWFCLRMHM